MKDQQHIFEQIEDYINGRMSEKDTNLFEQMLNMDLSLAAKVDEAKAANEAIHFACLADLKKTVGKDIKNIKYRSPLQKLTNWILGSAILITAFSALFIFTQYFEEESTVPTSESKEASSDKIVGDNNQNPIRKELSKGNKKNSANAVPSSNEATEDETINSKESEVINKVLPENTSSQTTLNEAPNVSHNTKFSDVKNNMEADLIKVANNCNIEFNIRTESSCKHNENGSIIISANGDNECTFQVDNLSYNGTQGVFHNLPSGEHKVLVTYNKECTFTKIVKIEEKWCPMNQAFSFNPDYSEKWEMKYDNGAEGKFIIYDRSGKEVYKNTFGSGSEHWNGTDMNGNIAPIGNYAAIIYYSDGRTEKVDLTIVR